MLFEIAQVYLRLADCRVYKGHLQNEWAIKPFRKYPKSNKFVCVKSSLQFMHNVYPFLQIPGYLEIPLTDFCETLHRERQALIKYAQWDSKMKGAATELLCRATLKAPVWSWVAKHSDWKFYPCQGSTSFHRVYSLKCLFDTITTPLFTNMRILKFKSQLTIAFFAAVNHLNGPLRKQNFTLAIQKVKVCDLWLVDFDPFCVFLCFKVHCLWS